MARACARRHRDGVWRSANEVPQGPGGRPLAFVAVNGHGAYPIAGTIPRIFYAVRRSRASHALVKSPPPAHCTPCVEQENGCGCWLWWLTAAAYGTNH